MPLELKNLFSKEECNRFFAEAPEFIERTCSFYLNFLKDINPNIHVIVCLYLDINKNFPLAAFSRYANSDRAYEYSELDYQDKPIILIFRENKEPPKNEIEWLDIAIAFLHEFGHYNRCRCLKWNILSTGGAKASNDVKNTINLAEMHAFLEEEKGAWYEAEINIKRIFPKDTQKSALKRLKKLKLEGLNSYKNHFKPMLIK